MLTLPDYREQLSWQKNLKRNIQIKIFFFTKLTFSASEKEQGYKDYCDYRKNNTVEDFLSIKATPYEPRETTEETAIKKFEKKATEKKSLPKPFDQVIREINIIEDKNQKYLVTDTGIWLQKEVRHDKSPLSFFEYKRALPQPVQITNVYKDAFNGSVSVSLEWEEKGTKQHTEVPITAISFGKYIEQLTTNGIHVNSNNQKLVINYFHLFLDEIEEKKLSSEQNGWVNKYREQFILGEKVISAEETRDIRFTGISYVPAESGKKEEQTRAFEMFKEDSQLTLRLGTAAISPFIAIIGCENYIDHIWGGSSSGKSFSIQMAASLFGNHKDIVKVWNTTRNGRESYFEQAGGLPNFLDEAHQAQSEKDLQDTVYDFAQGIGRSRGRWDSLLGETKSAKTKFWTGLLLSTGEKKITETTQQGGVEGRILEPFRRAGNSKQGAKTEEAKKIIKEHYGHFAESIIRFGIKNKSWMKEGYKGYFNDLLGMIDKENELQRRQIPYIAASLVGCDILEKIGLPIQELFCRLEACKDYLSSSIPTPTWKKALNLIESLVSSNIQNFGQKQINETRHAFGDIKEIWGRFDYNNYLVDWIPSILFRELKREGFSPESTMDLLKQQDRLLLAKGRNQRKVRVKDISTWVFSIKLEKINPEDEGIPG